MPKPTWSIEVDLTSNGDFANLDAFVVAQSLLGGDILGGTGASTSDLTPYLKDVVWNLGFSGPFEPVAEVEKLQLVLNNSDRRFSPENTSSPLYPNFVQGKPIRIKSSYSGSTFTHFLGWIDEIAPTPGIRKSREVTIQSSGLLNLAQGSNVRSSASEGVTADIAIRNLFDDSGIVPEFSGYRLESGLSTLPVVGSDWDKTGSVYSALQGVVGQEMGRLYVDRDGKITFWNRDHLLSITAVSDTIDNTMTGMDYSFGDNIINSVRVRAFYPVVASSTGVLGTMNKATKIRGHISFYYGFFSNTVGIDLTGMSVITPASGTDYSVNTDSDGSGEDFTDQISACIVSEAAGRVKIEYTNDSPEDVWLQSGAQVQGQTVTDYSQMEVKREDSTSIGAYLRRSYSYPYPLSSASVAKLAGDYILSRYRSPKSIVRSLELQPYGSACLLSQTLTLTIGDRITVMEDQTSLNKDFFIVGERYAMDVDNLVVTWVLEEADSNAYWFLGISGFSELDGTTLLGPF